MWEFDLQAAIAKSELFDEREDSYTLSVMSLKGAEAFLFHNKSANLLTQRKDVPATPGIYTLPLKLEVPLGSS